MIDDDIDELRALRTRAYGAGGAPLSPEEADRLRALESSAARRQRADTAGSRSADREVPGTRHLADAESTEAGRGSEASAAPPRGSRAPMVAAVVLAGLIPLAAVGGYLAASRLGASGTTDTSATAPLLGRGDTEATYEDRREVVLRAVELDGARPRLLAAVDGTTVWWGTRGEMTCLAVDVRQGGTAYGCDETATVREEGMSLTLQFVRVPQAEQTGAEVLEVTDDDVSTVTFFGNPYTGRFFVHRAD